ncbi:MAG TPA: Lrp/AsnC family transcriptional regulator [Oceanithermus sp.]|nr:Lrp/AsnC family transcriptional regulator [Oceanithermus sp.]
MLSMPKVELDARDRAILDALQEDARLSFAALARRVGMSPPAVAERVRRLEAEGVIRGYGVRLDLEALGYPVTALVAVAATPERYPRVWAYAEATPEVRECYFVTGEASFVLRVVARSIDDLRRIIEDLGAFGSTRTSVALRPPLIKTRFPLAERPGGS